ncbi:MAG: response regulator [Candidatus Marinimicrobia bacterium]|nr:response regulator [Candidatus Neomarinimicrobiota bacterium]
MKKYSSQSTQIIALVVEDDPACLDYLVFLLKKLNIELMTARTGEEALELMEDHEFNCFLLDISLGPGITGIEVFEKIREIPRFENIPVFAVTATMREDLQGLLDRGFTKCLEKPYKFDQLKSMLYSYFPQLEEVEKKELEF